MTTDKRMCAYCFSAAAQPRSKWCLQCELSGDAMKHLAKQAKCLYRGCNNPRYRSEIMCEEHTTFFDEQEVQVELIYEWCMKCVMCGRYRLASGTRAQAQATQLFYKHRCQKCGGKLELQDEERVVGRYRVDTEQYH